MNQTAHESDLWQSLESLSGGASSRRMSLSPNDGFAQISWPLVLILAIIAAVTSLVHGHAIKETTGAVEGLKEQGKHELILEIWKQKLIRRIDHVCTNTEQQWRLHLFSLGPLVDTSEDRDPQRDSFIAGRIKTQQGWPSDPDFQHLCQHGVGDLVDMNRLRNRLYLEALTCRLDAEDHSMFDPVMFPDTAPRDLLGPNVIGGDTQGQQQRQFALERLEHRIARWGEQMSALQLYAVERVLESPEATTEIQDSDSARTAANIVQALQRRGYHLLPDLLQ